MEEKERLFWIFGCIAIIFLFIGFLIYQDIRYPRQECICEFDKYNAISKIDANQIVDLTNIIINLFNACNMATGIYENETLMPLLHYIIP